MFARTKGDLRSLPKKTQSAFHFHVLRSLHQMALVRELTNQILAYPIPWTMDANFLVECWYQSWWTKMQNRTQRNKRSTVGAARIVVSAAAFCARANVRCVIACRYAADPRLRSRVPGDSDSDWYLKGLVQIPYKCTFVTFEKIAFKV